MRSFKVKNKLLGGAAVLAVGSVVAKIIGALYRIPLTNILGAEGMGMYQLVFPVYALFMTLSTAGIPTALSRVVAEKRAAGEPAKKYLVSAIAALAVLSAVATLITVGLSKVLALSQGNPATRIGYLIIAPSIFFVGLSAGFRGWFQGEMNMVPTAVSNIISQTAKLAFGIGLAIVLKPRGVFYSVAGALIGVTASEIMATLYLFIRYLISRRKSAKESLKMTKSEAGSVLKVALPIALVAVMMPLSNFFDSLIIVNTLKWGGASVSSATASYGLLSGPVSSLINMPIVIIMSLAVVALPVVSVSRMEHNIFSIMSKSRVSIKLTYFIGIPCAFFMMIFAGDLVTLLYPALTAAELSTAKNLLIITSSNVVLLSAMQIYISLLQALDRTKYTVLSLGLAIIVKVVLTVVLVKFIGITGAALASVAMAVTGLLCVTGSFIKTTSLHIEKNVSLNLLSGVIMALIGGAVAYAIKNALLAVIIGFISSAFVYVVLTLMLDVVGKEDLAYLPFGKYLLKIRRVLRFWEIGDEDGV